MRRGAHRRSGRSATKLGTGTNFRRQKLVPVPNFVAAALCVAAAWGQPNRGEPHLGYVYPAGARQGAQLRITAAGQSLQGVSAVYVSGEGVQASVVEYVRPLSPKQLGDVAMHLRALTRQRLAELQGGGGAKPDQPAGKQEELPALPDHPLLRGLKQKTLAELAALREVLFNPKKQPNLQIAETVSIDVLVDPAAAPGDRELRLGTPAGLTNPVIFQVGVLPEAWEQEPNDPRPVRPPTAALALPVLLNGQIMPGDVDRFRFRAEAAQQLAVEAQARHLIPYLADAVPGWFQATVALYDAKGNELAFADDYRFDPDPVLFYRVPQSGEYELEIRDAIYRGREDFVYRISVGELPFITQVFPLGGRTGVETLASVGGWNLPWKQLPLDTAPGGERLRQTALCEDAPLCNRVAYAVDDLPECEEAEPNDAAPQAQRVQLPLTINGRIGQPGDVDVFGFNGRAGEDVVAEVYARRLNSPLDSLLRLVDAKGKALAWNDDHEDKGSGLVTHHADSYLSARLPSNGVYQVQLSDAESHGGEAYAYRLRLAPPQPDFALRVTPSSLNVPVGRAAVVWAHALRKDGFNGDIDLRLKDAPAGFRLDGAHIPAGRDSIRLTLAGPATPLDQPLSLQLEGAAQIDGRTVTHPAVPCEDMMQAFAYRHLTPAQELRVAVIGGGRFVPTIAPADGAVVRLPTGGTAVVRINAPGHVLLPGLQLELRDPPKGVTIERLTGVLGGFSLTLKADKDTPEVGYKDNLIIEASIEVERKRPDGTGPAQKRRVPLGVLPAIAFEIVAR